MKRIRIALSLILLSCFLLSCRESMRLPSSLNCIAFSFKLAFAGSARTNVPLNRAESRGVGTGEFRPRYPVVTP